MHSYAQTNIQLFNQLRREGYSNTDISCVFNAYQLTMRLFTGCYRPSGKTFIAHLVGTASILCSLHLPVKVIAASLIHAAYASQEFGNGEMGISNSKRRQIIHAVGKEVEEYVARYKALKWNERTLSAIYDRLNMLDSIDRYVVVMRLANELEENLDFGLVYCGDDKYQQYTNRGNSIVVEIAQKLGFPTLAAELARVFEETAVAEIPRELCNHKQNSSFVIAPQSYQKRWSIVLRHWLTGKAGYLRSTIVRRLPHSLSSIAR